MIGPDNIGLICKIILLMDIAATHMTFISHRQNSYAWPGLPFQTKDFWLPIRTIPYVAAYWYLLCLVVWSKTLL